MYVSVNVNLNSNLNSHPYLNLNAVLFNKKKNTNNISDEHF